MTRSLKLGDTLNLPADEAVTQKYGFIGRSGSGKSYAAMKLAELFLGHGAQIIALDWVGIWWSLRLAKNAKSVGFPHVYIFGGEHQDVDLRPESGALMADLIVDKHISVVLDVMHFRKAERTRFATAFAEQFFHRKKTARTACHLFIEEAQAYLPQMVRGDEARMVGVFEDIGKVGRNYGIGNSLISQRPQAINKDVLNQVEVLLAFQTNGPQERKAIAGWTAENTDAGAAMIQQLPKLDVGHALVWSPQWLRIAKEVHIEERDTYDASSTPTQTAKAIKPKTMEKSDLEQLGEQIAATIEKAKADDPRELRKQIAELKKELSKGAHIMRTEKTIPAKPVLTDADRALLDKLNTKLDNIAAWLGNRPGIIFTDLEDRLRASMLSAVTKVDEESVQLRAMFLKSVEAKGFQKILGKLATVPPQLSQNRDNRPPVAAPRLPVQSRTPVGRQQNASGDGLGRGESKVLTALAQYAALGVQQVKRTLLAAVANISPTSSAYDGALRKLRDAGLIHYPAPNLIALTDAGVRVAPADVAPATTDDKIHGFLRILDKAPAKVFRALTDAYPEAIEREELAARSVISPTSSSFDSALRTLRDLGIATYPAPGQVRASEELFG